MSVVFGLDAEYEEWLPYPEAPDEEYGIRPLTDEMIREWTKQTTRKVWRQHVRVEERDEERYNALLCDQIFAGWRGAVYLTIEDAKAGRTSEATLDNKIKFAGTQAERFNWIATMARELGQRVAQQIESQREAFRQPIKTSAGLPTADV